MSDDKSRASHHVEDLSVLARRGTLSSADERAFATALEASAILVTAHRLGLDFDQVALVKPGDEALIAEMATRAVNRQRPARFARFRLRALLLVATLALAGSATAFWRMSRAPTAKSAAPAEKPGARRGTATNLRPVEGAQSVTRIEPPPLSTPAAATLPSRPAAALSHPASPRADEPSGGTFESAESLFREANAARRAGDAVVARALYLRLEHDFPASDEAHLAHVSLGNLLLAMGRASEAEQQFASYLGGHPALAQEALVGRAQSLAALGRSAEEQGVWQALVDGYPGSVYAGRAKQRLAELTRSADRAE